MKTKFLKTIACVISVVSCSVIELDHSSDSLQEGNSDIDEIIAVSDNKVSITDIYDIIERDFPQFKSSSGDGFNVVPYLGEKDDTLMYIVNLNDDLGWRIYSSDKRTPAVIAEGESGCFSLEDGSPAVAFWISGVAYDMSRILAASDDDLTFKEEEISANKSFWPSGSRSFDKPLLEEYPEGHWEVSVSTSVVEYERVEHMVAKWDQYAPYNACSPYYEKAPAVRAVAGCVAVAGAQVLHYLHNKLGVPVEMYKYGSCTGTISDFERDFDDLDADVWEDMNMDYQYTASSMLPEAVLIGYVGQRVDMSYCDNTFGRYSWALPRNLQDDLFEYHGISCSHGDFDEEIIENSLLNQMPVIVSASDLMIPVDGSIHCFVVDGYRSTRTKYTYHHYYVVDEVPSGIYALPDDYCTYAYSSPQVAEIKINWGWSTQWDEDAPVNDGWYSLTGSWYVNNGGYYDYNRNRKMIYGFAVAQ